MFKNYIYLSLVFLTITVQLGCSHFASSRQKDLAQLHFKMGTNHLERGVYPEALKELLTAETYDSSDPFIENNLGLAYFMREKYDLAEDHLRKAVHLEPKFTEAKNNLSRVLIEKNNTKEAKLILKQVLDDLTYPVPWKAYINLGLAEFKESHYLEAKNHFLKAVQLDRENCLANNYYARSLMELKDYKKSSQAFEKAENFCINAQFDEPIYFSAINYYRMGELYKSKLKFEALAEKGGPFKEKSEKMLEILRK